MRRILMFGDRDWVDPKPIRKELHRLIKKYGINGFMVIEGKARGADSISGNEAKKLGVHVAEIEALWKFYGNRAGPARNKVMWWLKPDEAICFHADLETSKGSKNMYDLIENSKLDIKIKVVTG